MNKGLILSYLIFSHVSVKSIKSSECEQIRSLIRNDLLDSYLTFSRANLTLVGLSVGILSNGVYRICFGTGFRSISLPRRVVTVLYVLLINNLSVQWWGIWRWVMPGWNRRGGYRYGLHSWPDKVRHQKQEAL